MEQVYLMPEHDRPYIAGPMRGHPKFNFDAFYKLEAQLNAIGVVCFNPARRDEEVYQNLRAWPGFESGDVDACPEFNLATSLQWDLAMVAGPENATCLVALPGWEKSQGVAIEMQVAAWCQKPVLYAHTTTSGLYNIQTRPMPNTTPLTSSVQGQLSFDDMLNSLHQLGGGR